MLESLQINDKKKVLICIVDFLKKMKIALKSQKITLHNLKNSWNLFLELH